MRRPTKLTIGRLAAASGVNLETIRYYERIGLMSPPDRTEGGHRVYAAADRRRLAFVRRGRELGFSLDEVRALLALAAPGQRSCADVESIAAAHLKDVRAKIVDLARLEAILSETVSRCAGGVDAPSCPVLEMLEGAERD